jgi:putative peptide zinc metalloprotease protein
VPLPVSRVRETGLVQIKQAAVEKVRLKADGVLKELHVQEGQRVKQGAILATFTPTQDQQKKLDEKEAEFVKQFNVVEILKSQISEVPPDARDELQNQLKEAEQGLNKARKEKEFLRKQMDDNRQLAAPRGGLVMGLPKKSRINEEWKKEKSDVFCEVGEPSKIMVLLPVSPDDHDLLRESMASAKKHQWKLPVVIRVQGRDTKTWEGEIVELPQAVAKKIPIQLTNKGGGALAVKPAAGQGPNPQAPEQFLQDRELGTVTPSADEMVPQNPVYLVEINILHPDSAIAPGALAQVKVYCEYRSAAWWAWRSINKTFDLGLM